MADDLGSGQVFQACKPGSGQCTNIPGPESLLPSRTSTATS
jgi:hypothetical protein